MKWQIVILAAFGLVSFAQLPKPGGGGGGSGGGAGPAGTNGAISVIQDETIPLTVRSDLNFTGGGVTCVDNAGATRTDCTITDNQLNVTGNAGTANALAADPADCSVNQPAIGVAANGTANCITLTANIVKSTAGVLGAAALVTTDLPLATVMFPIINELAMPDNSGNVTFQPYTILAATGADLWAHSVIVFADISATDSVLHGRIRIPQDFVSGAEICTAWTSTIITGDVIWGFSYRSTGGTGSLDGGTVEQTVTFAASTAPGTAQNRVEPTCMALTDANIAVGDIFQFRASRNGTSVSDTMGVGAISFGWWLKYQGR